MTVATLLWLLLMTSSQNMDVPPNPEPADNIIDNRLAQPFGPMIMIWGTYERDRWDV